MIDARQRRHVPALDGVRGLAVGAVLAFHSGYAWASGGFLGVSVFFTLSGYLITSLLLAEHQREGSVSLAGFYTRRVARLLPASLLGLLLALAVGHAAPTVSPDLHGDVVAAMAQVTNWRWLTSSQSYADLFTAPSAVLHYWSLAIEEQFYLLFPPLVVCALRRSIQRVRVVVAVGLAVSWLLLVVLVVTDHLDVAYYATPSRLGEILAGCLLGCVAPPTTLARQAPRLARFGGVALAVLALEVVVLAPAGRWTYLALPLTAGLSMLVIAGAVGSGGLSRALSWRPLVELGRVSYGVYVFHWPVFLYLNPLRTGLGTHALTALRVAVTLVLATASYVLIEQPVLRAARERPRRGWEPVAALAVSWLVVASVVVVIPVPAPETDLRDAATVLDQDAPAAADEASVKRPSIAVFGDSTAAVTSWALVRWGEPADPIGVAGIEVPLGCGLELPGERRFRRVAEEVARKCEDSAARWRSVQTESGAPVALIQSGSWEVLDRRLPGDAQWRHLGDPVVDAAYRERFHAAIDELLSGGAQRIVWLTSPTLDAGRGDVNRQGALPENDPDRVRRYNELVREVAAERPEVVVVDYGSVVDAWSEDEDSLRRVDGVHLSDAAALAMVEEWLGPALLDVFETIEPLETAEG